MTDQEIALKIFLWSLDWADRKNWEPQSIGWNSHTGKIEETYCDDSLKHEGNVEVLARWSHRVAKIFMEVK